MEVTQLNGRFGCTPSGFGRRVTIQRTVGAVKVVIALEI